MENILLYAGLVCSALIAFLLGVKASLAVFKDKTESTLDDKAYSVVSVILEWLGKINPFLKK